MLLCVFILVLVMFYIISTIQTSTDLSLNNSLASVWIGLGWITLALLWGFCIGHLVISLVDAYYGIFYTNKQLMDQNIKSYYYNKIAHYEDCNVEVPSNLIKDWMKKAKLDELPKAQTAQNNIDVEIEDVVIKKLTPFSLELKVSKASSLRMNKRHIKLQTKKNNVRI